MVWEWGQGRAETQFRGECPTRLDSAPGLEQGLLFGSSAGSGRGHGRLPTGRGGQHQGAGPTEASDARLQVLFPVS